MRADRLVAALLFMQTRGRVTAAELADELEVSVATARRDLEALSAAGIPVYPQPGRGGGWSLVGGAPHGPERPVGDRGAGVVSARRPGRGRFG
jgi:predicted DNA-binding transcriptional regulator YafY